MIDNKSQVVSTMKNGAAIKSCDYGWGIFFISRIHIFPAGQRWVILFPNRCLLRICKNLTIGLINY